MEIQGLKKYTYFPPLGQTAKLFTGLLAVQISWNHLGTNSKGEILSLVTLTKSPEAQQAQWPCLEASRTKVQIYWATPRCERAWM